MSPIEFSPRRAVLLRFRRPMDAAVLCAVVANGFWIVLKGLKRGAHALLFGGAAPKFDFSTDTTYTLTVR